MRIFISFAVTGRIRANPENLSKTNGLSEMSGTLNGTYFHFLFSSCLLLIFQSSSCKALKLADPNALAV